MARGRKTRGEGHARPRRESARIRVALTVGDPGGIGPEIAAQALRSGPLPGNPFIVLIGGLDACRQAGWSPPAGWRVADAAERPDPDAHDGWAVEHGPLPGVPRPARADPANGRAALACVDHALRLALDADVDAIVTGPVSKEAIERSGTPFTGHTEYLASAAHVRRPVMLCVAGALRVAFVTSHLALRKVPAAVTTDRILSTAILAARALREDLGIQRPRLAVCALNPHAGEGGRFGREDGTVVAPAVARLREEGVSCEGPLPSEGVFRDAAGGRWDAVIALYHDQGMIPIKAAWEAGPVNMTLGLPFVRTSPAHGTAFDLAGRGGADPRPMRRAIEMAVEVAARRRHENQGTLFS